MVSTGHIGAGDSRCDAENTVRLIFAAAQAFRQDCKPAAERRLREVAALRTSAANRQLRSMLDLLVESAWAIGWQPTDLAHQVRRQFGARPTRVLVDAIAAQMRRYAPGTVDRTWSRQLSVLNATVWWTDDDRWPAEFAAREALSRMEFLTGVAEIVAVLSELRPIPLLCPPPGKARDAGAACATTSADQERILRKVRALLAKAESTDFPEEAETLSAQAQQLMAKYSIDAVLLDAAEPTSGGPLARRIGIDNPYESAKVTLLTVIAGANRCRAVWHQDYSLATVLGFAAELDAVELLFTSLLLQASTAMARAGSRRDGIGRSVTRSFRHSFLLAYAHRIGERLRAATTAATAEATTDPDRVLLPALLARGQAVDAAVDSLFGRLTTARTPTIGNPDGWHAGRAAANTATLHPQTPLPHRTTQHHTGGERSLPPG